MIVKMEWRSQSWQEPGSDRIDLVKKIWNLRFTEHIYWLQGCHHIKNTGYYFRYFLGNDKIVLILSVKTTIFV